MPFVHRPAQKGPWSPCPMYSATAVISSTQCLN